MTIAESLIVSIRHLTRLETNILLNWSRLQRKSLKKVVELLASLLRACRVAAAKLSHQKDTSKMFTGKFRFSFNFVELFEYNPLNYVSFET